LERLTGAAESELKARIVLLGSDGLRGEAIRGRQARAAHGPAPALAVCGHGKTGRWRTWSSHRGANRCDSREPRFDHANVAAVRTWELCWCRNQLWTWRW